MPYLTSPPTSPSRSFEIGGLRSRSVVTAERVRLQLDVLAGRRQVEADQRAARRDAIERLRPGHVLRHRRQIGPLVLAADRAAQLDAPHLIGARRVAQRLERNRHLDRPAAVEAAGLRRPTPDSSRCSARLRRRPSSRRAAERVGVEHEPAAAIVEGVEDDAEVIVLPQLVGVAAQLVGDPLLGRRRVPAPRGDVDVVVVEHHPDVGLLGRRLAVARRDLQQAAEAGELLVDLFVEAAVELAAARCSLIARIVDLQFASRAITFGCSGGAGPSMTTRR